MIELYTDPNIIIKPADKGGFIELLNTQSCIQEEGRKLTLTIMRNWIIAPQIEM